MVLIDYPLFYLLNFFLVVIYNAKDWLGALRHFQTSYVIQVLLRRVAFVAAYGSLVTLIDQHWIDIEVPIDGTFFRCWVFF